MEQRKGADGRLAPLTKVASARGILALAVAVMLVLAGCGGDDSSGEGGEASAGAGAAAAEAQQGGSQGDSSADPTNAGGTGGVGNAGSGSNPGGKGAQGQGAGAKQGPSIAPPKGPQEPAPTSEQLETAKVADITLESPAVLPVAGAPSELPAPYTCDGRNSWPALRWRGVPEGTAELVLFAMSLQPVDGEIFFDWALAGIDPATEEIESGRLPRGAVTGANGFGKSDYSICPPKGQGETYFFALYALPQRLGARQGFDPRALRRQVQELSRNVGLLPVSYTRG